MISTHAKNKAAIVVLACRLAIATTGLHWLYQGYALQLGVALAALALTILPGLIVRDKPLRDAVSWVTAVLLAAHVVFGMQAELYETSALYDKAMHVLGSAAVAGLLLFAVYRYCSHHLIELPLAFTVTIVLAGTLSAGTLWELFEFAVDRTGLFYAQRGLFDTMIDLLADAIGAILMVATLWLAQLLGIRFNTSSGRPDSASI